MILSPGLQADEVNGGDPFFPKATIPPVKVRFEETITFAGSDRPKQLRHECLQARHSELKGAEEG